MSKTLFWPSIYHFYPIGNTSAVSLTVDLPPEEPAKLLLLGCGDPRNVLFTIFTEPENDLCLDQRLVSWTLPAVILTPLYWDERPFDLLWNTFFHFRIDKETRSGLIAQCNKLIELSETPDGWRASEYGQKLKMCTKYTLSELRRHWKLYVDMRDLPSEQLKNLSATLKRFSAENSQREATTILRSTGPLVAHAVSACLEGFANFWKTGTTFTDARRIADATEINPTFVYSLGEDMVSLHYGTDPLIPFHLSPIFANAEHTLGLSDVTETCREQFKSWCSAYKVSRTSNFPPLVRFFVGDAISASHALRAFNATGTHRLGVPVSQWKATPISLDPDEYINSEGLNCAPSNFNIIHTSNLEDHIGLLNNATKEFTENLKADITVIGLLLGVVPVDYLCGFSSRSNTHELLIHKMSGTSKPRNKMKGLSKGDNDRKQFHQMTTWKRPTSGDPIIANRLEQVLTPSYDSHQLGTLLYDIYQEIFGQETASKFFDANKDNLLKALSASNLVHYTRESFVHFLKVVRMRIGADDAQWFRVMDRFMDLQLGDWHVRSMDTLHYQDYIGQLLRHGLYSLPIFDLDISRIGRFSGWAKVPELVSNPRPKKSEPPLFNATFWESRVKRCIWRVSSAGSKANPSVVFEEDMRGWKGTSPLGTAATSMKLIPKLGVSLRIFSAKLMDKVTSSSFPSTRYPLVMTVRISLTSLETVASFSAEGSKVLPEINQISACVIRVSIVGKHQDLIFPFPIQGSAHRLRLARKSRYIEVIVPPSRSFLPEGMKLNPYPVISTQGAHQPWSIHRLNLEKLPILNQAATKVAPWFNLHLGSTLSSRERSMRKRNKQDAIMYIKDTIHSMFLDVAGTQQKEQPKQYRIFCLRDEKTKNSDTMFFINGIRFDLASHTLVCDAHVLPLSSRFIQSVSKAFGQLIHKSEIANVPVYEGEMESWKQLLPALVERCRSSWAHGPNCEYKAKNKIPLTEAMQENPLCSCGAGKDVGGMEKVDLWKPFAPYVTRIALSPLFAVSYLETVGRSPETRKSTCFKFDGEYSDAGWRGMKESEKKTKTDSFHRLSYSPSAPQPVVLLIGSIVELALPLGRHKDIFEEATDDSQIINAS
ncbi:hypothetical protein BKA70DRAFT_1242288 [Coprinopsis sp. MPI-PUGE-AT-0042]|nr:hypothetical protein BKA70DRAFT_1242288 [Coprinopsis sp. MPI-PUGE-AT-0042]